MREEREGGQGRAHACSLIALEREILGIRRTGDVPGFQVPGRYFHFVRTGDADPLAAVLEHNRRDLLSLAALTARLFHLARSGAEAARDAREAIALGRVYARAGLDDRACDAYSHALGRCRSPRGAFDPLRIDALRSLAIARRRARRYEEAASCWREVLDIRGCPPAIVREATEALAIHHEHRVHDLPSARLFALRTLESVEGLRAGWTATVQHRLTRIDRKMEPRSGARTLKFEV
jgi:tetratricopeptide (TPR) repeat protein